MILNMFFALTFINEIALLFLGAIFPSDLGTKMIPASHNEFRSFSFTML